MFVCVGNVGKSQMTAALAPKHSGNRLEIHSAGIKPGTKLNTRSVEAISDVDADMSGGHPKEFDPQLLSEADRIVILGADAQMELPADARGTLERWVTDESSERGIDAHVHGPISELLGE